MDGLEHRAHATLADELGDAVLAADDVIDEHEIPRLDGTG